MIGQGLSGAYTWLVYPGLTCSVQQPALKKPLHAWISFATLLVMFKGLDQDSVTLSLVNILSFMSELVVSHTVAPQCPCQCGQKQALLWEGFPH